MLSISIYNIYVLCTLYSLKIKYILFTSHFIIFKVEMSVSQEKSSVYPNNLKYMSSYLEKFNTYQMSVQTMDI